MRNEKHAEIEQKIADTLFLRHGLVLLNGSVEDEYVPIEYVDEVRGGKDNWYRYRNRRANGITRVYIGHCGAKKMFRQRRDGTMRYDDIADELARRYHSHKEMIVANKRRQVREQKSQELKEQIGAEYGLKVESWRSTCPIKVNSFNQKLEVKFGGLNEFQVRRFLDLAQEMGIRLQ